MAYSSSFFYLVIDEVRHPWYSMFILQKKYPICFAYPAVRQLFQSEYKMKRGGDAFVLKKVLTNRNTCSIIKQTGVL